MKLPRENEETEVDESKRGNKWDEVGETGT